MKLGKSRALEVSSEVNAQKTGQGRLYKTLCKVLDSLRDEAPADLKIYRPALTNEDAVVQARSRALLHLYLKARFGLTSFELREKFVTDGPFDGGIDAFYIDKKTKIIHILQSKFRASASNYTDVEITAKELLKMDVVRIVKDGMQKDEQGNNYNDKVQKNLQKAIRKLPDLARYDFKIVLLGNTKKFTNSDLKKLVEGYDVDQFPHDRIYSELLFPVINGTYFSEPNLTIEINLANVSGQSYLDYAVKAESQKTNIKLLFVPTREIGRIMDAYKNSVLQYNPRSFLELTTNLVNQDIERSIKEGDGNAFALFNNGVTIISDETGVTNNTAKSNTAQIILTNPQLVNGGQTAYTLGRIYRECEASGDFAVFKGKEVLLRVITFVDPKTASNAASRLILLGDISKASNSQTKVDESDRRSNDPIQLDLQKQFFSSNGLYYERKKGEFNDGIHSGYISKDLLVDRDKLIRVCLAGDYKVSQARSGITKYFLPDQLEILLKPKDVAKYAYGYEALRHIEQLRKDKAVTPGDRYNTMLFGRSLRYGQYALLAVCINEGIRKAKTEKEALEVLMSQWLTFEAWVVKQTSNSTYGAGAAFDYANYYKGSTVGDDIKKYNFAF